MKKNQIEASLRASICALVSTRNIASWVEPTLLNMRISRAQLALNGKAVIHCTVPCCYGDHPAESVYGKATSLQRNIIATLGRDLNLT